MNNMENYWKVPWMPSCSLTVDGGLSAVDRVEFKGWVPLSDPILGERAGILPRFHLDWEVRSPRFTGLFWQS